MKLTIQLERSDMTPDACAALSEFMTHVPEAKKRTKPETAPAAEVTGTGTVSATPAQTPAAVPAVVAAAGPTKDEVHAALRAFAATNGADMARKILTDHGAPNLTELPAERYSDVIATVKAGGRHDAQDFG